MAKRQGYIINYVIEIQFWTEENLYADTLTKIIDCFGRLKVTLKKSELVVIHKKSFFYRSQVLHCLKTLMLMILMKWKNIAKH